MVLCIHIMSHIVDVYYGQMVTRKGMLALLSRLTNSPQTRVDETAATDIIRIKCPSAKVVTWYCCSPMAKKYFVIGEFVFSGAPGGKLVSINAITAITDCAGIQERLAVLNVDDGFEFDWHFMPYDCFCS